METWRRGGLHLLHTLSLILIQYLKLGSVVCALTPLERDNRRRRGRGRGRRSQTWGELMRRRHISSSQPSVRPDRGCCVSVSTHAATAGPHMRNLIIYSFLLSFNCSGTSKTQRQKVSYPRCDGSTVGPDAPLIPLSFVRFMSRPTFISLRRVFSQQLLCTEIWFKEIILFFF